MMNDRSDVFLFFVQCVLINLESNNLLVKGMFRPQLPVGLCLVQSRPCLGQIQR